VTAASLEDIYYDHSGLSAFYGFCSSWMFLEFLTNSFCVLNLPCALLVNEYRNWGGWSWPEVDELKLLTPSFLFTWSLNLLVCI